MKYKSTRGEVKNLSFKEAVLMGLASDGGLIVPESIPVVNLQDFQNLDYRSLAQKIFSLFIDEMKEEEIEELIHKSYQHFRTPEVINIVHLKNLSLLELFYGPTFSFKDIALQIVGNLFEHILAEKNLKMNVLCATSGDTGSAAIYGLKGKKNINVFILHPYKAISPIQELQMVTVKEKNIFNIAVKGTFDVNYFSVPTGNFGNIFAAYLAKRMGLPIKRLILATNENDILTRFVNYGDYSRREVVRTISPSMDIQIASNFERYLYYFYDEDPLQTRKCMEEFLKTGKLSFSPQEIKKIQQDFISYSISQKEARDTIRKIYQENNYIVCPHTACGISASLKVNERDNKICLATAHPAKFPEAIKSCGLLPPQLPPLSSLKDKEKHFYILENNPITIKKFIIQQVNTMAQCKM
ncbi:MAG: hypothetical protein B6D55_03490 [Candidatus Omnitrophica bacterium 4484_70.2]|nr:MAG: hypothetical protein B6D55_03490 [Candidatus Omnitrophica bacterium 4484_70.2]